MTKTIRVRDLTDQLGMTGSRPFLWCAKCGAETSGNKSDYWYVAPDTVFWCCGRPMQLVIKQTQYVEVEP